MGRGTDRAIVTICNPMREKSSIAASLLLLSVLPSTAYAQPIPTWFVFAALSPLIVILFAIILGVVSRSWRLGVLHTGLVALWVLLFALASYFVENDYVIWTPIVLFAVHSLLVLILIIVNIAKATRTAGRTD